MAYQKTLNGKSEDKDMGIPITRTEVNRRIDKYIKTLRRHLARGCAKKVFPLGKSNKENNTKSTPQIARTLTSVYYKQGQWEQYVKTKEKRKVFAVLTPTRDKKRQNGRRFKNEGEEMFTLTGQDIHGIMIENKETFGTVTEAVGTRQGSSGEFKRSVQKIYNATNKIRRLTPIECERLQGFPDNWTEGVSDTQRYKQMGNAVTVNVIQSIGEKILEEIKSDEI